ncbi:hypothetical protein [Methanobacterium ferruginis]|uniref:hypothetical protein n=1 Tax=Methanobacterium ferruginis TaxID=710191 RepID=UPI002572C050|nr:hypothetical protein [Methanobacterium ferruginis]BDZ68607.1 hypothetical protein GCM10025860_20550 [Methanobacterium ferruginis]
MGDKSFGITVTGDISDVMSKLEEFTGKLDEIQDKSIALDVDINEGELDNLSAEANEAAEDVAGIGDASEAAGSEVDSSMSTASSSVSEVGTSASEAQAQVDELGDEALETGDEFEFGMNEATIAIMAATAALELGAQQLDEWNIGTGQLSIQSDIAEGDLRDMLAYITNATFPMEEAEQYVGYLDRIGVEGTDSLAKNATYMDWIHDSLGITSDSVIKLMQSYTVMGGNIDDVSESFNALYYAQSNMNADTMEQFIPWLAKYDFTLREMGLSWDAAAVAVVAAQKKFGGGRAAYQGLNEVIQESNGDISKMEELLGLQSGALSNASEETGKYKGKLAEAAAQEAEHKTLLQQIYAWLEDLGIKYGDIGSVIMQFGEIIGGGWLTIAAGAKLLDFFNVTENASQKWGQVTLNAFKRVIGGAKDLGSSLFQTIKSWIGWGDDAAKASETAMVKVGDGASRGASRSSVLLDEAGNVLWTDVDNVIGRVGSKAVDSEVVGSAISESVGTGFLTGATKAVGWIGTGATLLIDGLANYTEALEDPLGHFYGWAADLLMPKQFRLALSPEHIMKFLVGEDTYNSFKSWAKITIEDPMRRAIDETWGDVSNWWNDLTGQTAIQTTETANNTANNVKESINSVGISAINAGTTVIGVANESAAVNQQAAATSQTAWELFYTQLQSEAQESLATLKEIYSYLGYTEEEENYTMGDLAAARGKAYTDLIKQRNAIQTAYQQETDPTKKASLKTQLDAAQKQLNEYMTTKYTKSGQNVGSAWSSGVISGITSSTADINAAAAAATQGLVGYSPPKTGPLQEIGTWAENIADAWIQGLVSGLSSSKGLVSSALGDVGFNDVVNSVPLPSAASVFNSNSLGGVVVQFTGPITVPEGSDPVQVGQDFARGAAPTMADELRRQVGNMGINPVNDRR